MKTLLRNTLILTLLFLSQTKAFAALKHLIPVNILASTNLQLDLQVVEDDLALDLSLQPELQFQIRPNSLHVSDSKSASFKMDVFLINDDGSREFIASQNTTIAKNRKKQTKRFTITLDSSLFSNGLNDIELEVFNTAGTLINLYSLELQGFNKPDKSLIDLGLPTDLGSVAECEDSSFGDCQLDYFFRRVNFELRRESKAQTKLIKDDGQYTVVIPFASGNVTRSRRNTQQTVLDPGTIDFKLSPKGLLANLEDGLFEYDGNGLFFTVGSNRINLTDSIQGAVGPAGPAGPAGFPGVQGPKGAKGDKGDKGDSANLNGAVITNGQVVGDFFTVNADLFIPQGAVDGYVLTVNANGKASWANITTFVANGDNLGNHTASQNLDLASFSVLNATNITATSFVGDLNGTALHADNAEAANTADIAIAANDFTIDGTLTIPTAAAEGSVLTSDATGNASWQVLTTVVPSPELFIASSNATELLSSSSFVDVPGMSVSSVTLTDGDILRVSFAGSYFMTGTKDDSYSRLRFTFNDIAMGPMLSLKNIKKNTDTFGPPHMMMLKCGTDAGEINPGTYSIKLQAQADAGEGDVDLSFGQNNEEYDLYVEILR